MKLSSRRIKLLIVFVFLVLIYYFFALYRPAIIIQNNTDVPIYLSTLQSAFGKEAELEDLQAWKGSYKILPNKSKKFYLSFGNLRKKHTIEISNGVRIGQRHEGTTELYQSVKTSQEGACQITMMVNSDSISLKEESGYFCHKKLEPVIR